MNDFTKEPKSLKKSINLRIERIIESGNFVLGENVKLFEDEWKNKCNFKYAIGVGNGMDAIEIILRSLNISAGDEVITTSMTAFATVLGIFRAGATPVLADIDPNTSLMSVESAERCITKKTKAILLVHLYGKLKFLKEWESFNQKYGIFLIEDCAQSHLAHVNEKYAGSFGIAGAYSFYPTKNLGAVGDAGMVVTKNKKIAEKAKELRNYGQTKKFKHNSLGLNSRLDEIQAGILYEKLKWLETFTNKRISIANKYNNKIKSAYIQKLDYHDNINCHVYHLYVIKCKKRNKLKKYLKDNDIQSLIHYPIPINSQTPCKNLLSDPSGLQYSKKHSQLCLSLPCHPFMNDEEISKIIDVLNNFKI